MQDSIIFIKNKKIHKHKHKHSRMKILIIQKY